LIMRHEWKHIINHSDMLALCQRLQAIMHTDSHGIDGCYTITSLYFDTPCDRALRDKLDGISRREKFRIRYYNKVCRQKVCRQKGCRQKGCCPKGCRPKGSCPKGAAEACRRSIPKNKQRYFCFLSE